MGERHQFRADWHDYNEGVFFITICCGAKQHYFGEITKGRMSHSEIGLIVEKYIEEIPSHCPDAEIWNHVVMPNHLHFIVALKSNTLLSKSDKDMVSPPISTSKLGCLKPKMHNAPERQDFHHNSRLAVVVGQLKGAVTRETKRLNLQFSWQSRFYENVIYNQRAYMLIMNYIDCNEENWDYDRFNAAHLDLNDAPWNK